MNASIADTEASIAENTSKAENPYRIGKVNLLASSNDKENERIPGKREEEHYDTDDRKFEFLQRYGWLIDDDEVRAHGAKFKPKNDGRVSPAAATKQLRGE